MILYVLFLVVTILILYILHYKILEGKIENFINFKRNIVKLTNEVENPLRISTGDNNYIYNYLMKIIKTIYPIEIINHGGSSYGNINSLLDGSSDLAICQLDTLVNAYQGKKPFTKSHENLRFITSVFTEKITLLVKANSNIYSWQDLKNKKVCAGKKSWGGYYNFRDLLETANIKVSELEIIEGDVFSEEIISKFESGNISALYLTYIHPSNDIYKLYYKVRFRIIGFEGLNFNLLRYKYPFIQKTYIGLTDYNMSKENSKIFIETYGIPTVLATRVDISEKSIHKFIKSLFQNIEYIRNYVSSESSEIDNYTHILQKMLPSELLSFNNGVPLHMGAHVYYKSIGIINNIDNRSCLNYAGVKNCDEISEYKHYGHGHFSDILDNMKHENMQYESVFLLKI